MTPVAFPVSEQSDNAAEPADATPELLDDARKLMRRKAIECLAEADRLDALFAAVTVGRPGDAPIPPIFTPADERAN